MIDVYPVGLLRDLRLVWLTMRRTPGHAAWALRKLRRNFCRSWRRRSYWSGYLAEPTTSNVWTRAGHGWSKTRARRDFDRHLAEIARRSVGDLPGWERELLEREADEFFRDRE
jgi:hypothetical protein